MSPFVHGHLGQYAALGLHHKTPPLALGRHDAILREPIETHRGVVFQTVGDAFYAAFAQASDGVAAALCAQVALRTERWGEVGEIRVRMGLHTGDVGRRGDHYFDGALYRYTG
jgi:class 3 adenylate cyclase